MSRDTESELRREAIRATVRLLLGLGVFVVVLAAVSWTFRAELERFGTWFVARFGKGGMVIGALLADGVHFPIPPQFYLLAGIAGGFSRASSLVSVAIGSMLGGLTAFNIARTAAGHRLLRERVRGPRQLVAALLSRHGYWGLAAAGLLPISYWFVCSVAGLLRLPHRASFVLAIVRVPRLVISYVLIVLVWDTPPP